MWHTIATKEKKNHTIISIDAKSEFDKIKHYTWFKKTLIKVGKREYIQNNKGNLLQTHS